MDINGITAGYSERMARMALFDPLHELDRKKQMDQEGRSIDLKGLGLLTLLYFFEQKLVRNQKAGVKELAAFLKEVTMQYVSLHEKGFEDLARMIIQTFRPAKKRETTFFNWETKQQETINFSILKDNSFDVRTNSQYYTLDEHGLELIFATKEFYSEFQLSINQLLLRKQLEKGEFKGALRQINEMRIDVESLEERMVKLEQEIKRNIISEETYSRYQSLLEDIYYRLNLENEEFQELHAFVNETKERLYYKDHTSKEQETYQLILEIAKHLEEVHAAHTSLLQKSMDLKNSALQAAQESLYYVGIDSFNFDQDITSRVISAPLPLEAMKGLLVPFMKIQETKTWSLLTVFAEQNIKEERETSTDNSFMDVAEEETRRYQERLALQYRHVMELLLEAIGDYQSITLEQFFKFLKENHHEDLLDMRFIYDFFLLLHHRSPIQNDGEDEENTNLLDGVMGLLDSQTLTITEQANILHNHPFSIQNMMITIGSENNAL